MNTDSIENKLFWRAPRSRVWRALPTQPSSGNGSA